MGDNNIKKEILEKIKSGEVKMTPKSYFTVRSVLFVTGFILVSLFAIYLVSFIVFSLRVSGFVFLPLFGVSGLRTLFVSLPWLLILLCIAFIVMLELFAEHVKAVYQRPAMYSLFVIIGVVLFCGYLIGIGPLHTKLFHAAQLGSLPLAQPLYDYGAPRVSGFTNGAILEVNEKGFIIETPNEEIIQVMDPEAAKHGLKEGDTVFISGGRQDHTIKAGSIKKVREDHAFFPIHHERMKGKGKIK